MISAHEKIIQLEKGGHIALDEYGDPHGLPVFFCHGWPSSRAMAALTDDAACELGLRIISPDRPGIRQSTHQPGRRLLDWPPLLRELAANLEIEKFRILAISGGAPYAYAAAWSMPDQVEAIAVVSGAPPIDKLTDENGLLTLHRWMLAMYRSRPELLRKLFHVARPFASFRIPFRLRPVMIKIFQPCDAAVMRDAKAFEACFESQRQAWRISAEGVMVDAEIYVRDWGFPLEEITVPVRLWHGKFDRTFAFRLAEAVAARLPNCEKHIVENAGHFSLPIRQIHQILADLKQAGTTAGTSVT